MSGIFNGIPFGNVVDRLWSPSGELLDVLYAPINIAALGDNTVVAAHAGKRIYIISLEFVCAGAVTAEWLSGAGAVISKGQAFAANGQKVLPFNPAAWGATALGELLKVNLSAAVQVSGSIQYVAF